MGIRHPRSGVRPLRPASLLPPALLLLSLLLPGCAGSSMFRSYPQRMSGYLEAASAGRPIDLGKALKREVQGSDAALYRMERGRLAQLQGDVPASRRDFEAAIAAVRAADEEAVISAGRAGDEVASWLLNDNARRYDPDDYERIFLHHFQALNYLFAGDLEGAGVEVRRANAEQEAALRRREAEIETARKAAREKRVPTGRIESIQERFAGLDEAAGRVKDSIQNAATFYLSGVVYEALGQPGDAYIDYKRALEIAPSNRYVQLDVLRLAESLGMREELEELRVRFRVPEGVSFRPRDPGEGELVVLFEEGFVPPKREVKIPVPLPGGGFGAVAFPTYEHSWVPPEPLHVGRFNIGTQSTEPIAYVDAMAVRALREEIPGLIVRHLIRTTAKAAASAAVRRSDRDFGPAAALAVDIWNYVSENADLRSWLTLPRSAQVLRARMPSGRQTLTLRHGESGTEERIEVEIRPGRITLLHVARAGGATRLRTAALGSPAPPVATGAGG